MTQGRLSYGQIIDAKLEWKDMSGISPQTGHWSRLIVEAIT